MNEIGGYFGLDLRRGRFPHDCGILLNSGCNAIRLLIRGNGIRKINVPYYTCPSVWRTITEEGCEIAPYKLGEDMLPSKALPENEYVIYNNYFGVSGRHVDWMAKRHPLLLVDAAQAYYSAPKGTATIYSPRKFVGVPDGGMLVVNSKEFKADTGLKEGVSCGRAQYLLERLDIGAHGGYVSFKTNEEALFKESVSRMSKLTYGLLGNIDYSFVKTRRLENFAYLHKHLPTAFPLALGDDDVPMVYPYTTNINQLRERLIAQRVYVATYWPGISGCGDLQKRILPLPIDQRYDENDMRRIVEVVKNA